MSTNQPLSTSAELALRRALERQVTALAPMDADLQSVVAHPPLAPPDWHGPASQAYGGLVTRLRVRLSVAESAVSTALQTSRLALAELGS